MEQTPGYSIKAAKFVALLYKNHIPIEKVNLSFNPVLHEITENSREVLPGFVFVASKGTQVDSHKFIKEALEKGALLCVGEPDKENLLKICPNYVTIPRTRLFLSEVASAFYRNPSKKIKVIGITGTNGKTTTSYLLRKIFGKCALMGTVKYLLPSGKEIELPSHLTTPPATAIQRFLRESLKEFSIFGKIFGRAFAVMEVSSHALATHRVNGVRFSAVVFTNLSRDHLDFHKTMEGYRRAKLKLFEMALPESPGIINRDDENFPYFWQAKRGIKYSYGFSKSADYRIENIISTWEGTELTVGILREKRKKGEIVIWSPLSGKHNAYNITAAFATAHSLGVPIKRIKDALKTAKGAPGRMEKIISREGKIVAVVDYAHTPDAMENILKALRNLPHTYLITVFGAGGNRDRGKRPLMAQAAEKLSDSVIVTSDNPRFEEPMEIIKDIMGGFSREFMERRVKIEEDRKKAIFTALNEAKNVADRHKATREKPVVVAILGKGHEDYQEINGQKRHFSDREVALEGFAELNL